MSLRTLALASACLLALGAAARADTAITILHVNENAAARTLWDKIAADYNASHKGVTVKFEYLENEAFKAKLPTMLQSTDSRPALFYSWAGGVMEAQNKAGFLADITKQVADVEFDDGADRLSTLSRSTARRSACPSKWARCVFYYNKALFEKAGVKAEDIKTWDDFLGAVKKIKAAGITPIVVGAGEKWPMAFFYDYLVMRVGGESALSDAKAGKNGGFKSDAFVKAGERLHELGAPRTVPARLSSNHPRAVGGPLRRRQGGDGPDGRVAARHAGARIPPAARACLRTTSAFFRSRS